MALTKEEIAALTAEIQKNLDAPAKPPKVDIKQELTKQLAEVKTQWDKEKDEAIKAALAKQAEEHEKALDELKPQPKEKKLPTKENDPTGGFPTISEFGEAVAKAGMGRGLDPRLKMIMEKAAGAGMEEGVDSEGGFLVPEEHATRLLENGIGSSDLLSRVTEIPMQSNSIAIPCVVDTTRASGLLFGGVIVYRKAEEGTGTSSKPKMGEVRLTLHKLFGLAYSSDELIEDSPVSIGAMLERMFTDAFAAKLEYEIINGTGTGELEGLFQANCKIQQDKEEGQTADTIEYDNIVKMYSRMPGRNRRRAVWLINDDCIPQLFTLNLAVGTGGVPVFMPANGASATPYDTLFGRPIISNENCATIGDAGDIWFWDPTEYLHGVKAGAGIKSMTSLHFKFDTDETAFRWTFRDDGMCWWPGALTPRVSSTTLSPVIDLQAR